MGHTRKQGSHLKKGLHGKKRVTLGKKSHT